MKIKQPQFILPISGIMLVLMLSGCGPKDLNPDDKGGMAPPPPPKADATGANREQAIPQDLAQKTNLSPERKQQILEMERQRQQLATQSPGQP